jgi:flagellar hook-associated protein 2
MSGISSSTGLYSGIDTQSLISQLLQIEARPKVAIQKRVAQLQSQQAAFLDLNSRLGSLRSAAQKFRISRVFDAAGAQSTDDTVAAANASAGAAVGSYTFLVDRLVNTKQVMSRGFSSNAAPIGATSFTFEPEAGRLDRDTELSQLNGGEGIQRGNIIVTDSSGASATVDLSRVASVNEVLDAINAAEGISVTASVDGDHFVLTDTAAGGGGVRVQSAPGSTTAESLGLAHTPTPGETTVTGSSVYRLTGSTLLTTLNDANGIRINSTAGTGARDFSITVAGNPAFNVNLGAVYNSESVLQEGPADTVQEVIDRINAAAGGLATASIKADGSGIQITSTTGSFTVTDVSGAAADLGIAGASADVAGTQTVSGSRVLAGMNSTLVRNIRGGSGLGSGELSITTHSGAAFDIDLSTTGSIADIIEQVNDATGGAVTLSLDNTGTGFRLTDNTTGVPGSTLRVSGGAAEYLGLETVPAGTADAAINGGRMQHRYVSESTLLSSLNGGRGIGNGRFEIRDSTGQTDTITIDDDSRTIGDLIAEINSRPNINIKARINDNGDGIIIEEENPLLGGTQKIKIRDLSGSVADGLNLDFEATGDGAENFIDGSFERKVEFTATDTLDDIVRKVNQTNVGARASLINDGSSAAPFRLSFTSTKSGREGRFTLDAQGVDLGLTTLAEGRDARAFFGSDDPASGILLTSTTNTLTGVIQGVTVDLRSVDTEPVTINITRDTDAVRTAVGEFVTAFNAVVSRIDSLSTYDQETKTRGTLLGDTLSQQLRSNLYAMAQSSPTGVTGQYQFLSQVGVSMNSDGELEIDQNRLDAALERDPDAVKALFAERIQEPRERIEVIPGVTVNNTGRDTFSSLGIAERLGELANNYLDPIDGFFAQRKKNLDTQITQQRERMTDIDARIERKQVILEKQFLAMEQALGQLQSQQSALGGLLG